LQAMAQSLHVAMQSAYLLGGMAFLLGAGRDAHPAPGGARRVSDADL